jgi:uncharacterized protein
VPGVIDTILRRIADELGVREGQVRAAVELLDAGATVPFIARYRKEATGTLDDSQLRSLEERLGYLRELEERRAAVVESIRAQGKLDDVLEAQILAADSKARLEDIYLPYKPKRRTKAQVAREAGLEALADGLLTDPRRDPESTAAAFVDPAKGVADPAAALDGARAILAERFAEDADLIGNLRGQLWSRGRLVSRARRAHAVGDEVGANFADYFDFAEPFTRLPSHRVLAMFRGEKEDVLDLTFEPDESDSYEAQVARRFGISDRGRPADAWLTDPHPQPPGHRCAGAAEASRRGGSGARLRHQPPRPPPGRPGRRPPDHGPRPGLSDRGQGGGRRRHRQGGGDRGDLPTRAPAPLG